MRTPNAMRTPQRRGRCGHPPAANDAPPAGAGYFDRWPHGARAVSHSNHNITIRRPIASDVPAVTRCVCAAYLPYIERVGKQPAPMLRDYAGVLESSQVHVAEADGRILGVLELMVTDEGFLLDSVAVAPSAQGTGVGRRRLRFAEAEARHQGYEAIHLMTHEKMTENQALYARIGYALYDRRLVDGYSRILMRKVLV